MEWTRDRDLGRRRDLARGAAGRRESSGLHARPRQPARPDLGVRDLGRARPGRPVGDLHRHGLHGHTHIPIAFTRSTGGCARSRRGPATRVALGEGRTLLNPGSVGQPRDGDPRASYLILDLAAGTATWGRVAYDFEASARRCARQGCRRGWPTACGSAPDARP